MQDVRADQARQRADRVRREARLAMLEYQCEVLRGEWAEAIATMRKRSVRADTRVKRNVKRWAAAVRVLEERVARQAAAGPRQAKPDR